MPTDVGLLSVASRALWLLFVLTACMFAGFPCGVVTLGRDCCCVLRVGTTRIVLRTSVRRTLGLGWIELSGACSTENRSVYASDVLKRLSIQVDGKFLPQQANAWQSAGVWLNFL